MQMFDLSGRVAVITGGNGGIGLGMAEGLAKAGCFLRSAAARPPDEAANVLVLRAMIRFHLCQVL